MRKLMIAWALVIAVLMGTVAAAGVKETLAAANPQDRWMSSGAVEFVMDRAVENDSTPERSFSMFGSLTWDSQGRVRLERTLTSGQITVLPRRDG
jgi:hypothetical protein